MSLNAFPYYEDNQIHEIDGLPVDALKNIDGKEVEKSYLIWLSYNMITRVIKTAENI